MIYLQHRQYSNISTSLQAKFAIQRENCQTCLSNPERIEQFLQFINTGDATIGKPIISDDVIFYAPTSPEPMKGFEGYMGVLAMMRGAMPDIQWKIEETISEGDKILVRYTMTGTQTQPLMGMPATGKKICVTAMNIYEFKDNLCNGHEHL